MKIKKEQVQQIIDLYGKSWTIEAIAKQVQVNEGKVYGCIKRKFGIKQPNKRAQKEALILGLHRQGYNVYGIYKHTGIAYRLIKEILLENGIGVHLKTVAPLTDQQKQEIIAYRSKGLSYTKIAKILNLPKHRIFGYCKKHNIIKGKRNAN